MPCSSHNHSTRLSLNVQDFQRDCQLGHQHGTFRATYQARCGSEVHPVYAARSMHVQVLILGNASSWVCSSSGLPKDDAEVAQSQLCLHSGCLPRWPDCKHRQQHSQTACTAQASCICQSDGMSAETAGSDSSCHSQTQYTQSMHIAFTATEVYMAQQ